MHRRILLTGASGGLGLIIAELLLQEGHFVYLHCHSHPNALQPLCKKYPSHTKMIAADLLVDEDLNVLFQSTEDVNVLSEKNIFINPYSYIDFINNFDLINLFRCS